MCAGLREWIAAIFSFKVLRADSKVTFACESRRLVRVEPEQVSKRVMKRFNELRPDVEALGLKPNYYASIPAIGKIAVAVMTMSRVDGQVHFFAVQVALQTDDGINDDGHFGFSSHTTDGGLIVTTSPARLPRPRRGVDRLVTATCEPAEVYEKHRRRVRGKPIRAITPDDLFAAAGQETRREADDLQRRRIIRPATPAEIGRIRTQSRV